MREEVGTEEMEEYRKKLEEFGERQQWKSIKIRRSTYEQVKKVSKVLDIRMHEVIDLSVLVLRILMSEKVVLGPQRKVGELGLAECVERWCYDEETRKDWAELDPVCVLKKVVLPFYKKKKVLENLMRNVEKLSEI